MLVKLSSKLQYLNFKEFGDPRTLNCRTGVYEDSTLQDDRASSIIFFNIYCPYTPYGL